MRILRPLICRPLALATFIVCALHCAAGQTPVFPPDFGKPKLVANPALLPDGANRPPSSIRVTYPASSAGVPRALTVTAQVFDPDGWNDIRNLYLIISDQLNSRNGCFLHVDVAARTLRLANDAADAWTSLPQPAGTPFIASNSRCSLHFGGASVAADVFNSTVNATPLTAKIPISFTASSPGSLNVYAFADDLSGAILQWSQVAAIILSPVQAPTVRPQSAISLQSQGISTVLVRFNTLFADMNGSLDITKVSLIANDTLSAAGGCLIEIDLRQQTARLANDAATDWLQPAGVISANTGNSRQFVRNSSCGFDPGNFDLSGLPPNEMADLQITGDITLINFTQGAKFIYANVEDSTGLTSGWSYIGKINSLVPAYLPNPDPNAGKYPPLTGNRFFARTFAGDPAEFYVTASDNDGVADLSVVYLLLNSSITTANGCLVEYDPGRGLMRLAQDSGTGWLAETLAPGAQGTLANSQCEIIGAGSVATISTSARRADLLVKIRRKASFAGSKNVYTFAVDKTGRTSGWDALGQWVPGVFRDYISQLAFASEMSSDGPFPYTSQSMVLELKDPEGLSNISTAYVLLSDSALQTNNACLLEFKRIGQRFQLTLANDAGLLAGQIGLFPFSQQGLNNSQCEISGYSEDQNLPRTTQTALFFTVAFKPQLPGSRFSGQLQLSGRVLRTNGFDSGWTRILSFNNQPTAPPKVSPVLVSHPQSSASLFSFPISPLPVFDKDATQELLFTRGEPTLPGSCWMKYSYASSLWQLDSESGDALQAGISKASGMLANSRCRLVLSRSFDGGPVNVAGFYVEFLPAVSGPLTMYTRATNVLGQSSGWVFAGIFVVPPPNGLSVDAPLVTYDGQNLVPAKSGFGVALSGLQVSFQDLASAQNLTNGYLLINNGLNAQNGCFIWFDLAQGVARLAKESGQEWIPNRLMPRNISGPGAGLENANCRITAWEWTTLFPTNVMARVWLEFKPAFAGTKRVYASVNNLQGQSSGWRETFGWVVPQVGAPAVSIDDTPANEREGEFGTIVLTASLAGTMASMKQVTMLIGSSPTDPEACRFRHVRDPWSISILNEGGTAEATLMLASPVDAEISYRNCTFYNRSTKSGFLPTATQSALQYAFRMQRPNREIFGVFAKADAENGASSEWTQVGTWTVPGKVAPTIRFRVPATHLVANPNAEQISFLVEDGNGREDLTNVYAIIRTGSTTAGACFLGVDVKNRQVRLAADSGQEWLLPTGQLGNFTARMRNSQCEIRSVSWGGAGGRLGQTLGELVVDFSFTSALRGRRQLEVYVEDAAGLNSTWRTIASIDIP